MSSPRWASRVLTSWSRDAWLILWLLLIGTASRAFLIIGLSGHHDSQAEDLLQAFSYGFRFDIRQAVLVALPTLLLGLFLPHHPVLHRLRTILGLLTTLLLSLAAIASFYFFKEYHDQFNHFVFLGLYEDQAALGATVWSTYPVVRILVGLAVLGTGTAWMLHHLLPRLPVLPPLRFSGLILLLCVPLLVAGARGSVGRLTVSIKSAGVTGDVVLNRLIPPPLECLRYAANQWRRSTTRQVLHDILPDGDLRAAVARLGGDPHAPDLDHAFPRQAAGAAIPPRHVVLVIGESYSAWPLWPPHDRLGLADAGRRLGREGLRLDWFVSAGSGTIYSLTTLFMGLPNPGETIMAPYQPGSRSMVPTALAGIFRRLGYHTRLTYSGFLTWQRIGDWALSQGFDDVRGAGDLGRFLGGREWGVEDEDLFAATADLIAADTVPTLTVILTTSNHPPYSIDVTARGYKPHPDLADADPRILGHYWYADRALGAFAERLRPIPGLFLAVTGDHYGRQFVHDRPTIAERTAVPLVLWGSGLDPDLRFAPDAAGSHLDLVPTLVERCAPTGFIYQALGRDLLAPGATVGLGRDIAVTAQKFMQATLSPYAERNRYLTAVGWWRLTRDSAWPTVNDLPKQDGPE